MNKTLASLPLPLKKRPRKKIYPINFGFNEKQNVARNGVNSELGSTLVNDPTGLTTCSLT